MTVTYHCFLLWDQRSRYIHVKSDLPRDCNTNSTCIFDNCVSIFCTTITNISFESKVNVYTIRLLTSNTNSSCIVYSFSTQYLHEDKGFGFLV